jgi:hypothetical protein
MHRSNLVPGQMRSQLPWQLLVKPEQLLIKQDKHCGSTALSCFQHSNSELLGYRRKRVQKTPQNYIRLPSSR